MAEKWFDNAQLVRGFISALIEAGVEDTETLQAVCDTPQKFGDEYELWETAGFPSSEADDKWEDFANAVGEEEESS